MNETSMRLAGENGACIRARRMLSLALDGEAAVLDLETAASHLSRCERCGEFVAFVAGFTSELRSAQLERLQMPSQARPSQGDVS